MKWRTLRRILIRYTCQLECPPGVGNRINISRTVIRRRASLFRSEKREVLSTQTHHRDEGSDVEANTIGKIRRELEIDDEHGIDSKAFYDEEDVSTGAFIIEYRKLLRRLARL